MAIESECPGCGRRLRVADEYAGAQARCPACNTIYLVPGGEPAGSDEEPAGEKKQWYMKTPEGQVFGPVAKAELDRWLSEGRISAECLLRTGDDAPWRPADEYYGVLGRPAWQPAGENPFAGAPAGPRRTGPETQFAAPHRGGLILAFGILGWVTCPIFALAAWIMGSSDLREMRNGRMDPSGRGLTQAGYLLGMIYSLLWIAGAGIVTLLCVVMGVVAM